MKKILSILCLLLLLIPYTAATAEQKYYSIGQLHDLMKKNIRMDGRKVSKRNGVQ